MAEGLRATSSPRKTPYFIVGGLAVAGVVGLILALSGGGGGPLGAVGDDQPEVPAFDFEIAEPAAITTSFLPNPEAPQPTKSQVQAAKKRAEDAAQPAATAAIAALDELYTAAFLDPANWTEGVYDEAFAGFSARARDKAESEIEVLTVGAGAGELTAIEPMPSTVKTKILLDPKGVPTSVVGIVKFEAAGEGGSGRHLFVSRGQFFFEKVDGEWKVIGFSVTRADEAEDANAPTASPSGSAS